MLSRRVNRVDDARCARLCVYMTEVSLHNKHVPIGQSKGDEGDDQHNKRDIDLVVGSKDAGDRLEGVNTILDGCRT